tara:strand:- start:347 stop:598 length:252 start_codon:yes stop_codon:yes gene_type:complete
LVNVNDSINKKRSFFTSTMVDRFQYKVVDYVNIDHHNYSSVEEFINELGNQGFELIEVIDMGENNTNKDGKSSRFRYIFKKNG